ncbi:MAG: imidazolonepropionase [Bryobacteraceae bacterium]
MSRRLFRGARQLLTLRGSSGPRRGAALGELAVIEDGAVLVEDGVVTNVGPTRRLENLAETHGAEVVELDGCVAMPGFVDSHTHLVFGQPRLMDYEMRIAGADYHQIAEADGGILSSLRHVRGMARKSLETQARKSITRMIQNGTTTLEAKTGYGLDEASEIKVLRVIEHLDRQPLDVVATFLGAHVIPHEFAGRGDDYIDYLCEQLIPKIALNKLARFADVYCEPGAFTVAQSARYLKAAIAHGMTPKIHADQFVHSGGTRLGVELGAASADHLEQISNEDIRFLGVSSTVATLLPGSVFHLGLNHYAPARRLIDGGAAVALATDFNPGTSPTCSMPMILSLACTQMRMSPAEAITAATINGAHAIGMGSRVGSLEYGKQADLIVLDAGDYREIPYYFGVNLVKMTVKRGEIIYSRGLIHGTKTN